MTAPYFQPPVPASAAPAGQTQTGAVTQSDLAAYAKTSDVSATYAKTTDLAGYTQLVRVAQSVMATSTTVPAVGKVVADDAGSVFIGDGVLTYADMPADLLRMPPPRGPGLDDTANLLVLLEWARANNKGGVALRAVPGSAPYRFTSQEIVFPDGVILVGPGDDRCAISMTGNGAFRFGILAAQPTGQPKASTFTGVGGWRINANNSATSPLRIGYCTAALFQNIRVTNAKAGGAAILVQICQNSQFFNMESAQNNTDGWCFDLGCANISVFHTIVRDNKADTNTGSLGRGVVFTMSGDTPADTAGASSPRNIRWIGGLIESNDGPNIYADSGGQVDFLTAQTSHTAGVTTPSVLLSDAKPTRPLGPFKFIGGQLKAGSGDGVALRVLRSSLAISSGTVVSGADWPIEVSDGGRVTYTADTIFTNNTPANGLGRVIATTEAVGSAGYTGAGTVNAGGTLPFRAIVHPPGEVNLAVPADQSFTNTTALADVNGFTLPIPAGAGEIRGVVDIVTRGDPAADLKLAFTYPAGTVVRWTIVSLPAATTTSTGQMTRDLVTGGAAGPRVGIIATDTTAQITFTVVPGTTAGNLVLQAAQFAASTTATVVTVDSRMTARGVTL